MLYNDHIVSVRQALTSSYHGCSIAGGLHDYGKGFWNPNKKFAKKSVHGVCGYWFRKCKHCGRIDRWRTIFRYFWVAYYDRDDERNIMARAKKRGET